MVGAVFRAKNLSVSSYGGGSCGYGIHFARSDEIIIFNNLPVSGSCEEDGPNEEIEKVILDSKVEITDFPDILFIPPEPKVEPESGVDIKLELKDGSKCGVIKVSKAGQITQKECLP